MYMKLKDGKSKVLTLSYDDGVIQDVKLINVMNKYGLKGTFNINTGLYTPEDEKHENFSGKMKLSEAKKLYINSGHEIAVHTLSHPFLEKIKNHDVLIEILEDKKNIEKEYKTIVRGMAYPFGTYNSEVIENIRKCGICYSRTTNSTESLNLPQNWFELHPTCHHNNVKLMNLAKHFVEDTPNHISENWMFYLWGHSYEFDTNSNWNVIENFSEYVGNREDIWYATNIEIYDYINAYDSLQTSIDKNIIHNPTAIDVWFTKKNKTYCIRGGETLYL